MHGMFAEKIVHFFHLNVWWIVETSSHSPRVFRSIPLLDRINKSHPHHIPTQTKTLKSVARWFMVTMRLTNVKHWSKCLHTVVAIFEDSNRKGGHLHMIFEKFSGFYPSNRTVLRRDMEVYFKLWGIRTKSSLSFR